MFATRYPTLIVFSHPNHELAVFGFLQRVKPHIVYLTDGGGPERVAETMRGLESIGSSQNARFLNHTESSLYEALLERDTEFLENVAGEVRDIIQEIQPHQIFCDAIEFYNPVHDLSLPIVRCAAKEFVETPVFEFPLVYQKDSDPDIYECQRLPAGLQDRQMSFVLSEAELDKKLRARDSIYTSLREQMGATVSSLSPEHLSVEVAMPARKFIERPGADSVLRYERRAQLLAASGEIERQITFRDNYLPVASALMSPQSAAKSAAIL